MTVADAHAAHGRAGSAAREPATLRELALAAVVLHAAPAPLPDEPLELRALRERVGALDAAAWPRLLRRALRRPAAADAPLARLAAGLGLHPVETLAVALAAAVEDDLLVGRAVARLQAPFGGSRPTGALLALAFAPLLHDDVNEGEGEGSAAARALDAIVAGRAVASGLLALAPDDAPLPERAAAVPLHLCLALRGVDVAPAGCTLDALDEDDADEDDDAACPLPDSVRAAARQHARALAGAGARLLVVRAGSALEGRAVARAVAAALGRRALWIAGAAPAGLAPWCRLRALLPVWTVEPGPGERHALPAAALDDEPAVALCGLEGTVSRAGALVLGWTLPVPTAAERRTLWARALDDATAGDALARDHRHGSGRIAHLGRLARAGAAVAGRDAPTLLDVAAAAWSVEGDGLDTLVQPLPDRVGDDALVLPPALRDELHALVLRCRARDGLTHDLGPAAAARYHAGVRALLVGPSGTGKTLAAAWLATRLGLPLWRVDLAAVTSKYIGETEKNLALLMARAEHAEVVLLFDEADSLFGKRTEVRDANDRFANAQTNYLLQRIETFEGIALLTSNSRSRFDAAFTRRLDAVVDFPLPGPEERRALWQAHLGDAHALPPRELNQLAARADVTGGHVRNVVLAAAVLARAEGVPIAWPHLRRALAGEYRKLGRQLPAELQR